MERDGGQRGHSTPRHATQFTFPPHNAIPKTTTAWGQLTAAGREPGLGDGGVVGGGGGEEDEGAWL